jgi:hypothetical protein
MDSSRAYLNNKVLIGMGNTFLQRAEDTLIMHTISANFLHGSEIQLTKREWACKIE